MMRKNLSTFTIAVCIMLVSTGCSKHSADQIPVTNKDIIENQERTMAVSSWGLNHPWNPDGDRWYEVQMNYIEWSFVSATNTYRDLVGCPYPENYQEILEYGLVPINQNNRYTGNPMVSTDEYSPGDIFYEADPLTGMFYLYTYLGDKDETYDPSFTNGQFLPWSGPDTVSDGKTVKTEKFIGTEIINGDALTADIREYFYFPLNDDARVRMYIISDSMNRVMYWLSQMFDFVPDSIDEYVGMLGTKNDVAWTNPYTGQPMKEVEWVDVPLYYGWEPVQEPISGLNNNTGISPAQNSELAGNYSYKLENSPVIDGVMRSYAQFYFKLLDGSIAAYVAIGMCYEEWHDSGLKIG